MGAEAEAGTGCSRQREQYGQRLGAVKKSDILGKNC